MPGIRFRESTPIFWSPTALRARGNWLCTCTISASRPTSSIFPPSSSARTVERPGSAIPPISPTPICTLILRMTRRAVATAWSCKSSNCYPEERRSPQAQGFEGKKVHYGFSLQQGLHPAPTKGIIKSRRLRGSQRFRSGGSRLNTATRIGLGLVIASFTMPVGLVQDAPPFGSSPEYKSMLVELAHEAPRPSRIANAGELLMGKVPDVPVTDKESPDGLRLEAQAWRVEIARN